MDATLPMSAVEKAIHPQSWQRSVFMLNLNDFYRHIGGVFVPMRPLPRVPQHKRRRLLSVFLHLARIEEDLFVRVSDDYVANLLDIERIGQTMRMHWLFAVWWDCYCQHSDVLILKDDLVSFRRYFHAIQFSGPRAYPLRAIILLSLSRPENNQKSGDKVRKQCDFLHESLLAHLC